MKKASQWGFTLIEVVIALMILSFLSLFTVESIQRALQTKTKVQKEIDKTSTVRDALRIMERDINLAFNYRDVNIALHNMTQKQRQTNASKPPTPTTKPTTPATTPTPALSPEAAAEKYKPKTEKIYTHFIGEAQSLDFTALSNVRMMEDSQISSQAEIGYRLKSCRRRSNQEQSSQCLWRRVANYIHDDITRENGQQTVLLENVTEFKLRYLGPGREQEWVETWMTTERGDDLTKNKFPYAVEITIEVKDPNPKAKDKVLRMTAVAGIRNPNNPPKTDPNNPASAVPGTPLPGGPSAPPLTK